MENGQSDFSYRMISKVADYLNVPVSEITLADEKREYEIYFSENKDLEDVRESVEKIFEIMRTFRAHENLYKRMKARSEEDNTSREGLLIR